MTRHALRHVAVDRGILRLMPRHEPREHALRCVVDPVVITAPIDDLEKQQAYRRVSRRALRSLAVAGSVWLGWLAGLAIGGF